MSDKLERGYASVANEEYRKGYRDGWRDAMEDRKMPNEPKLPNTPWVQPLGPGWPIPMPSYSRCPSCGLLKTSMTNDCPRETCPHQNPQPYTITYTTNNTSGK